MKIAIHHNKGSFSERWIAYCENNQIDYKIVNAYDSDIVQQLSDYDVFMWHHHHSSYKDVLSAKKILFALEQAGKKVFPDFNTGWYFDDKVAQKYLLEAIGAPFVPSYVFYDKKEALAWAENTCYPKVFKLKGGAGASNVKLIRSYFECKKYIKKSFGKGFLQFDRVGYVKDRIKKYRAGKDTLCGVCKGFVRLFIPTKFSKMMPREKGYAYFQDFIPGNKYDIRIVVVGNKAFGIKRLVRKNDFRASGSGMPIFTKEEIDIRCVEIGFEINKKIKSHCIAYDFVFDDESNPLIVEIGYGFFMSLHDKCEGYWSSDLKWHEGKLNPQAWIVESLIKNRNTKQI
ncbi:glutathione synthase/RimK-type ligase-like ATP-grasp enzyme [Parabacteroides sp. PFB2-10]|uniref:ATP-grasp domain-containing protein n=1 Tax=Parabacteroides sp. PFB2-10 TaxID=1742405 RepID=UPI0024753345|nr:hypothetical protein [Parabacteroides sp. PFB2-10]MDH6312735.1 glutathione synthase/RimK-type ligase-like ATP-grasp enzyme [Parabacteroides sp. PFB2-10]